MDIPIISSILKLFDSTTEIVKETVTDKDKQNQILENIEKIKLEYDNLRYLKELETKTIPWIDAVHKMGRQILNVLTLVGVFVLILMDKDIAGPAALLMGGGNVMYQWVKGQGK